jgi:hypothetical protein
MTKQEYRRLNIFVNNQLQEPNSRLFGGSIEVSESYAKKHNLTYQTYYAYINVYATHTLNLGIDNINRFLKVENSLQVKVGKKFISVPYKHVKSVNLFIGDKYF